MEGNLYETPKSKYAKYSSHHSCLKTIPSVNPLRNQNPDIQKTSQRIPVSYNPRGR